MATQQFSVEVDVPKPGRYKHFKGGEYLLVGVAKHSETKEPLVIYHPADDPATIWVRPIEMFTGTVVCGGRTAPRFQPSFEPQRGSSIIGRVVRPLGALKRLGESGSAEGASVVVAVRAGGLRGALRRRVRSTPAR